VYQGPGLLSVKQQKLFKFYRPKTSSYFEVKNLFCVSVKIQLCFIMKEFVFEVICYMFVHFVCDLIQPVV
jgi:hypothetical protein